MSKDKIYLNEDIRAQQVRCIGDDGTQYGIINKHEALEIASKMDLDLVLIAPDATPPVCKIMDYGKFKYQQEKRQKEAKKKQKIIEIKEIKLSAKTAQNDLNYKVKHALEFINEGKHVKFRVFLKGREMNTPEIGIKMLEKIWEMVQNTCDQASAPALEGRYTNMLVVPKK